MYFRLHKPPGDLLQKGERETMSLVVTVSYEPDGSPSLRDRKLEMKVDCAQSRQWAEAGLVLVRGRSCSPAVYARVARSSVIGVFNSRRLRRC